MTNSKITIIDDLHPEDVAMLQALQSRSPASVDERLLKVRQSGSGEFIERFYIGYGHQSIGDCGTTTIFIEGVSMLVAKAIQDWPLYSGQEASTRYMDFSEAVFHDPLESGASAAIQETWRKLYLDLQEPLRDHLRATYPRRLGDAQHPEEDEAAWERAISARVFDVARGFLPAGASTNLSWHTNLRQARDHLLWLLQHADPEVRAVAVAVYAGLHERYKHSFPYPSTRPEHITYRWDAMHDGYFQPPVPLEGVVVTSISRERHLDTTTRKLLVERPRGVEVPWFFAHHTAPVQSVFMLDFGSYRDLQRHRAGRIAMPLLTTKLGVHPWYLANIPDSRKQRVLDTVVTQIGAIGKLCPEAPVAQQYYTAMGFRVTCEAVQPLPAYIYRLELRSQKTVHPTLRAVVLDEIKQFRRLYPTIALHVDTDPDDWTVRRGEQTIVEKPSPLMFDAEGHSYLPSEPSEPGDER